MKTFRKTLKYELINSMSTLELIGVSKFVGKMTFQSAFNYGYKSLGLDSF